MVNHDSTSPENHYKRNVFVEIFRAFQGYKHFRGLLAVMEAIQG